MSRKTESKPATPSVIARLMGLDELQSQQPVNKQRKLQVLSENYLRKVASIGAWEKRSLDECRSLRFSIEETKGFKDAFEVIESVEIKKGSDSFAGKGRSPPERKHNKGSGFVDSRKGCSENGFEKPDCLFTKHFYDQDNPKVLQKLENGFVKDSRRKYGHDSTSMVPSPSSRKIVILKPKPGEAETNKKDKGFLGRGKANSHAQVKQRKNFFDGVKSTAHRSIPSETEMVITRQLRDNISDISFEPPRLGFNGAQDLTKEPEFLMVSSQNNSDVNNWYKPSCYNLNGSYVAQEAKQQIFERWRVTKDFRENGSAFGGRGRSRTLGEMLAFPDHAKSANFRGPSGISSKDGWKNTGIGDLKSQSYSISVGPLTKTTPKAFHVDSYMTTRLVFPWAIRKSIKQVSKGKDCLKQRNLGSNCKQSQSSPDLESEMNQFLEENSMSAEDCVVPEMYSVSQSIVSDMVVAVETPDDATKSTGNHNQHQVVLTDCSMPEKDHNSSFCIPDAWSQQEDVSMKISEECGTDPDFLVTLETVNQPSPVSVLEAPFTEGNSLSSKCFLSVTASLNDVKRQLEFLKSESIEEYSEGPGIVVSSDDEKDAVEEPLKEVNEYSTELSGVAERRDFSYLVDILTEAGFHNRNLDILFNGWHFPETPISLSVFETLEKKYGEQISWKRSARRLLFDRINSGLVEILQPCLGALLWAKPVARRLSYSQNSKEIVEELYKLLVSQENEAKNEVKKDSSEKVFGKDDGWLSLGYEIEAIGREIENSLIDELAAEILSL
ncbi:TON1 Recruiting Motif 19 [Hibiscus trionum]|uniref:TON1 Recruiting Motif 19 n=1 Tax=Hibiscus trionum TaxID=183268 RepID=A0A9W7I1X3_HIBTR|nr:TON1 Recruiting Motif 19 [Hibiscus trionum]